MEIADERARACRGTPKSVERNRITGRSRTSRRRPGHARRPDDGLWSGAGDHRPDLVGVLMAGIEETAIRQRDSADGGRFDATVTDLPLLRHERIWNFWQHSGVNVGLAVATWAFLQGAAVAYYVGVKQAIATLVIGYGVSVLLVALAPCMPSVKYGI